MLEIFKFPHVAIRRIADFLDLVDLLELSFCSKKSANLIVSLGILSTTSDIFISENTASFTIFLTNGMDFRWNFWHNYSDEIWENSTNFSRKIGNVELETCTKTSDSMHSAFENFESGIFTVSQHLLSIFPGTHNQSKIRNCDIYLNSIRSIDRFHSKFRNLSKVAFYGKRGLTKDEIRRLIENGVESMNICVLPKVELPEEIFQLKKLHLRYGFESQDYLKLKCARLTITFADQLIITDFNSILKNWQREGQQSKIRKWELHNVFGPIEIRHRKEKERQTIEEMFEGIERIEWTPELRKRYFRLNAKTVLDCEKGVDFLSHDGLLATVTFTWNTLFFVVWENRFPVIKLPPGMYFRKTSYINHLKARYHFITTDQEEWEEAVRKIIDIV